VADLLNTFFMKFPPGALAIWLGLLSWAGWKMLSRVTKMEKEQAVLKQAHTDSVERLDRGFKRNDDMHAFLGDQITVVGQQVLEVGSKVDTLTGAVNKMNGGST